LSKAIAKKILPQSIQYRIKKQLIKGPKVRFGNLRKTKPLCANYYLRGLPIDRYYIEEFLSKNVSDIKGNVLEMGDAFYTKKFGGQHVTKSDVMHSVNGNPDATIVSDLTHADNVPSDTFDCIILTQTLQMIYDYKSALLSLYRILKPGGVLLVTSHGLTRTVRFEGVDDWGEYWHFTSQSLKHAFSEVFGENSYRIETYGNVLSAIAQLHCIGANELKKSELDYSDNHYEVIIAVRAVKIKH
jgi:SAM-dependent methyltransferase